MALGHAARRRRAGASGRGRWRAVLAFLADGESWSSSALALALAGASAPCNGRLACGGQGAVVRSRASASLDDPVSAGIHDDDVVLPARYRVTRMEP